MPRSFFLAFPALLACAGVASAVPPLVIDDFVDPPVSVTASVDFAVFEQPSSAIGGFIAGTLGSPLNQTSTLTIDAASSGALRVTTLGQANVYLGYGTRIVAGSTTPTTNPTLSIGQDFSEYEILRINFSENTNASIEIVTDLVIGSYSDTGSRRSVFFRSTPTPGLVGAYDIVLGDIPGIENVELDDVNDVAFRFFTFPFASNGLAFSVDSIELIDLDEVPLCPGDCDGSENVDFNDLVAMLFEFGGDDPACDADGSGVVNFNDLVAALFAFGPCE